MNVPPEKLDELMTEASAGFVAAKFSAGFARRTRQSIAIEQAEKAEGALLKICKELEALGGVDRAPLVPVAAPDPLAELAAIERSRPEALALLDALQAARERAGALDIARGSSDDWEDLLAELEAKLSLDLFGPGDLVTGARE